MPDRDLFEYAVIRVVPRVEREEFINVGVILYCSAQRFLQIRFHFNEERLEACCAGVNIGELRQSLSAFDQICQGSDAGGPIGKLPMASRFRWLTAARSTVVQPSPVHPGLCVDAGETLKRLYNQLVG